MTTVAEPLAEVRKLSKAFHSRPPARPWRRHSVRALDRVDLAVARGETLAVVGESGSGKSTLARLLVGLLRPDAGEVLVAGRNLSRLRADELRRRRRRFQLVFQDAAGACDPRLTVGALLAEPLRIHELMRTAERPARVARLLADVGLFASVAQRYPHELSGGQRQRVGIARALACEPELLVLDEPVSALDVSVQAQILALLVELRRKLGLTVVLIAHDLAVVEQVADRVAVLSEGRLVEIGPRAELFARPRHPYTARLLAAVPPPDPTAQTGYRRP